METISEIDIIKVKIKRSLPLLRRDYKVKRLGVFGSYIHNKQKRSSDVDILVEFLEPISLLQFVELERRISEIIGNKVDLVMRSALKPKIGERILKEVIYI